MLIDLHCHTKKTKKGDGPGRNVTPELFREKIEKADVKIVAITNHNFFDIDQYYQLCEAVEGICHVWPGVEIDVRSILEKEKYHLIVVSNPQEVEVFSNAVSTLFENEDVDTCLLSLEKICESFGTLDTIFIPHFHNKKPAISEPDRIKLIEMVSDHARVFIEPRDHRTLGVLANNQFNVIIGSDVKDWRNYENSTFADLRLPVASFTELVMLAKKDVSVVKTLLYNKSPLDVVGHPHKSVSVKLSIFPDVNILFGQKGTGKSELLQSLYNEMVAKGINCKKYIGSDRKEDFSQQLSIKGVEVSLDKVQARPCDEEFQFIMGWSDANPVAVSGYINWIDTKSNSKNKSRMKITEMVRMAFSASDAFEVHKQDNEAVSLAVNKLRKITWDEYVAEAEKETILHMLELLERRVSEKRIEDLTEQYAIELSNFTIDKIKQLADRNSDTVSKPSSTGLFDFAKHRIDLYRSINTILKELSNKEFNHRKFIGSLEGKGNIYINTKYRFLCSASRTDEFTGYGIKKLRESKELMENILKNIYSEEIPSMVDQLRDILRESGITTTQPFLGVSKQIVMEDGVEYSPSNGEMGILLLQQTLKEDADAYFLDEPELGMGNSYIDTNIRPLLSDLAKQRKYVIVATHNANIAVRTLPYCSVFRVHENGEYRTYMGNPFDDRLVNVENDQDVRSWAAESMHTLEGGREAFYERRDIYESKDN